MEFSGTFGGRAAFLWLSFCIFLTLSCAKPEKPLTNVNLSPFWQWRSAYECLQNTSGTCSAQELNMSGIIQVTGSSQVAKYCNGCAHWTRDVLACIRSVKRDFWFMNNATVKLINDTISSGCADNSGKIFTKRENKREESFEFLQIIQTKRPAIHNLNLQISSSSASRKAPG
ncbi:uncharacterized protein LOC125316254 [Rhodamnia argentea]|uniref:Uncharacterized protein LOC125316254 n=1 Tax=Rhodamnia argentea TaxID=178133 RepID=A0ABM3HU60_9MYRT|nr:uncharacterized protein LOC125316254 [Rhodamnia argentea]